VDVKGLSQLDVSGFKIRYSAEDGKISLICDNAEMHYEVVKEDYDLDPALHKLCVLTIPHILSEMFDGYFPAQNSYILTDSKSGFLRMAPSLIRYSLTRTEEIPLNRPDREMLSKLIVDDPSKIKDEEISKIAEFLEEEMGGKVEVKTFGLVFPEIYFVKSEKIPILRSHSGIRELAPLIIYLRYVLKRSTSIVIEEPETHLHPYMQSVVARALAMLSRHVDVLITTHSPTILDELNNLIHLSKLDTEEKIEVGYKEFEGLDYNSLKIYRFKTDGTVEEVEVTEEGIEEDEFSSVVVELSNKYAEVEEMVWRKLHEPRERNR
jgi:hypothetical protein